MTFGGERGVCSGASADGSGIPAETYARLVAEAVTGRRPRPGPSAARSRGISSDGSGVVNDDGDRIHALAQVPPDHVGGALCLCRVGLAAANSVPWVPPSMQIGDCFQRKRRQAVVSTLGLWSHP